MRLFCQGELAGITGGAGRNRSLQPQSRPSGRGLPG